MNKEIKEVKELLFLLFLCCSLSYAPLFAQPQKHAAPAQPQKHVTPAQPQNHAAPEQPQTHATVPSAHTIDSLFIEQALAQAPADAGVLYFARLFLGRPYVAHTLEVNDTEQLVVNTRQLDCTTLIENVLALTLCHRRPSQSTVLGGFPAEVNASPSRYADFCRQLRTLRYRGGIIDGYPSRLHYFTDWILDNTRKGIIYEVQDTIAPFSAVQHIHIDYMSQHPKSYKALAANPALVPEISRQEQSLTGLQFRYIPKSEVRNTRLLRTIIHDGDIIAITCSKPGLDIAHLGFAVWLNDGLHLLNASQLHHKVVEEPMTLRQYLSKHPSHTGIRIVRLL